MSKSLPLGTLLTLSARSVQHSWRTLLVGIAAVAILTVLMQAVLGQRFSDAADPVIRQILGEERYQEVMTDIRLKRGGQVTLNDVAAAVGEEVSAKLASMPVGEQSDAFQATVLAAFFDLLPILSIFVPLLILVSLWSRAFFLVVPLLPPGASPGEAVSRATRGFLPILAVGIVVFFLSGVWIPIVAAFLALSFPSLWLVVFLSLFVPIVLAPRFIPAPVLYLREGGIVRSAVESFRRSRGFWWKIVGNTFVASLFTGLVLWAIGGAVMGIAAAIPSQPVATLATLLGQVVRLTGTAYMAAFQVLLSLAVLTASNTKTA